MAAFQCLLYSFGWLHIFTFERDDQRIDIHGIIIDRQPALCGYLAEYFYRRLLFGVNADILLGK